MARTKAPEQFYNTSQVLAQKVIRKPVTLSLPPAHPRQYELINSFDTIPDCRFVCGACGTKFGKTFGSTIAIVKHAWNNEGSLNWWVAPTYKQSEMAYDYVLRLLPEGTFREYKAKLTIAILTPNGKEYSRIEFVSGDNPHSLRGYAVNFFVIDEAARVPEASAVSVMTTVTQTMGKGLFISTPWGRGWFYDWYQRGQKFFDDGTSKFGPGEEDPFAEWFSIRMPTWSNPHVPLEAVRQFKKNMPEDVFRQEVAAQFLLDSAGVFRGINDCIKGSLQNPLPGHRYVMGVDLARLKDFSVITVVDRAQNHVVYHERFTQTSWEYQYARIIEVARRYNNATAVMDSTGLGDPVVETIQRSGVHVEPYKISSNQLKQQLIDKLRVNIENQRISFPANIPVLRKELEIYEYKVTDSNVVKFSAPVGKHDDCVISLALANWGSDQPPFVFRFSKQRGI